MFDGVNCAVDGIKIIGAMFRDGHPTLQCPLISYIQLEAKPNPTQEKNLKMNFFLNLQPQKLASPILVS